MNHQTLTATLFSLIFSTSLGAAEAISCKNIKTMNFKSIDQAIEKLGNPLDMQIYDVVTYTWKLDISPIDITVSDGKFTALDAPPVCGKVIKPEYEKFCNINKQLEPLLGKPVILSQLQDIFGSPPSDTNKMKGAKYHWEFPAAIVDITDENNVLGPLTCSPIIVKYQ